ncbi:hypothetical protein ACFLYU_03670 [Candidatus Dependentiae bacterium]
MDGINKASKGLFLMLAGVILLFYAIGILKKELIIFVIAMYLLAVGFIQFGGVEKVNKLFKK